MLDAEDKRWYVLFVRSNQEKNVAAHLCHRAVEHFIPCYVSQRQWKDRRVKLNVPLFPGYVFVRLVLSERLKVVTVPNVVSLVGTKNFPSIVSDEEIEWIRRGTAYGKAEPHPYLRCGQSVVIRNGALAGLEGILVRMQNGTRVLVCLKSISRAFTVEVESNCIEPVRAASVYQGLCGSMRDSLVTGAAC